MVVVFGQMIQQDGVRDQAFVIRDGSRLDGDCSQELFLIDQLNQLEPLLNHALDAHAVRADVAQKFGEISRLQDKFAQRFMADGRLRLAERARNVSIKADERKVVDGSLDISRSEFTGVLGDEIRKVDLRELFRAEGNCRTTLVQRNKHTIIRALTDIFASGIKVGDAQ